MALANLIEWLTAHSDLALSLLESSFKGVAILGLAYFLLAFLSRAASAQKHLIIRAALVAILLLPIAGELLPGWQIGMPRALEPDRPPTLSAAEVVQQVESGSSVRAIVLMPWTSWAFLIWLMGVSVIGARLGLGLLATGLVLSRRCSGRDAQTEKLVRQYAAEIGIAKPVRVVQSAASSAPFVWHLLQATIVLPLSARHWSRTQLRMVLLHELAHIRRRDSAWFLIASVAAAIHWFNPLVWLARRKFMIEAEKACDDYVLCQGADAYCYAEHLVDTARRLKRRPMLAPLGVDAVGRTQLEERIMSILSERHLLPATRRSPFGYLLAAMLLLVVPLAGLDLIAGDAPQIPSATATDSAKRQSSQPDPSGSAKEEFPSPDEFVPWSEAPAPLEMAEVVYPDSAEKAGVEGKVWVKALVDTKGEVRDVLVYRSSGHSLLDEAARQAAYKCKWKPAENGGKSVAVWIAYQVHFTLSEEKREEKAVEK